jgi:hypothetical protein
VKTKTTLILAFVLVCVAAAAYGDDGPRVTGARLYVSGDSLMSDLTCTGLFSEEITGTVMSGLPAVVEMLFSLDSRARDVVQRGIRAYELRYDVWEDHYTVKGVDTTSVFDTFEAMSDAVENLRGVTIIPLNMLDENNDYLVRFSIAVHPLRGREQSKIVGWVGETVRGSDEGSSRQQLLNLNDLIEHFFAREERAPTRSRWFETERFKPGLLPGSDGGGH